MLGILWRIIIAVIVVVLVFALLAPLSRILGFSLEGDVLTVIRICVAGLAIFYVLRGPDWPRP